MCDGRQEVVETSSASLAQPVDVLSAYWASVIEGKGRAGRHDAGSVAHHCHPDIADQFLCHQYFIPRARCRLFARPFG
jgi:hypothetical protein